MSDAPLPRALAVLLERLVDYAGLFPPAGLDMAEAVRRHAGYRASVDRWVLGRFVVPVARLDEFERALGGLPATAASEVEVSQTWSLTALASPPLEEALARVEAFNRAHAPGGFRPAQVDSIEIKAASADEIAAASAQTPREIELYCEVPAGGGVEDLCGAAAAAGRALKIRTGGTTIDAFPPSAVVARFLGACAAARVPFKATAGLHHPFRSAHPVTYDTGAPSAMMHGYLNVFVAAALAFAGQADEETLTRVLEDELPAGFVFGDLGLSWRERRLDLAQVAAARRFARSVGSCAPIGVGNHFPS